MPASTPSTTSIPASTIEGTHQLHNQDVSDGSYVPQTVVTSPKTSRAVEPAHAPIYPRGATGAESVQHRTSITAADTVDPTAVPTWVGYVSAAALATATTLHVLPHGDYGTPPISTPYQLVSGATTWDSATPTAVSGGAGVDYTLTVPALAHAHAAGDLVVCVATAGTNTTGGGAGSVPSGAVGGRGASLIIFDAVLTFGSTAASATVTPMRWNSALAHWQKMPSTSLQVSATGTDSAPIYIANPGGGWYYAAVTNLSGTGATVAIAATVVD